MMTYYEMMRYAARRICDYFGDDSAFTFVLRNSVTTIYIFGEEHLTIDDIDEAIGYFDGFETTIEVIIKIRGRNKNNEILPFLRNLY